MSVSVLEKNEKKEKKSNSSQILQFQKIMHDNKIPFPAMDKTKFTFIDLFAGIGGMRIAFQNLGGKCVFSSEIDEQAQKTYAINFGDVPDGDITKIIYLDCDTMINTSLEELWEYDLKNKPIGAVNDYRSVNYQKNLGIMEENCYINSGVLLIDLIKYKENKLEERLVNAIGKYNGILEFPDNDVICKIAQNEIELLPLKYNVTSIFFMTNYKELKTLRKPNICDEYNIYSSAISNPSIVHFTTCFLMNGRPWMKNCNHPLTNKYLEYYKKTAWKDEPLQEEKSNLKNKIKRTIVKILPRKIMIFVVGIVHAYIKPLLQRKKLKSTRNKEIE